METEPPWVMRLKLMQKKIFFVFLLGAAWGPDMETDLMPLITILNRHPINEHYPEEWQTANTEVYHFPRGPAANLTVLSYAFDSTGTQRMWPVEWIVRYGKGRVYNSSMGHLWQGETYPPAYRCVGYQTTVMRATEWLATGKVTYPIPPNFPTRSSPSLKNEDDLDLHKP